MLLYRGEGTDRDGWCGVCVFALHKEREANNTVGNMLKFIVSKDTNIKKYIWLQEYTIIT